MNASQWAAKWNSLTPSGRLWMEFWEDYQQRFPSDAAGSKPDDRFRGV